MCRRGCVFARGGCAHTCGVRTFTEQGVVLRTQKLGEADRIVSFLTRGRGLVRAVARGVRRTSSKFGGRLEPFTAVEVQFFEGRGLHTVTQAVTLAPYGPAIVADYGRYRAGSVVVETAARIAEGQPSPAQFELLVGALRTLAYARIDFVLVRDGYLLRAMSEAGWHPEFSVCVFCGDARVVAVSVEGGGAVCERCRPAFALGVSAAGFMLLRALLAGDWGAAVVYADACEGVSGVVAAHTQWHLERGLRSLG